ncbi:MAG: flavin reductase family protein [Nitrospirae bacterium]|nr:flavin reductase family protein [Nitrospirota bacterium]
MKELDRHEALELASPFPYVLAVTLDKRERPNIMGLSWWMFTSWDPLMIAISVGHQKYSHECLEHHKEFVLCFPSEGQEKDAWTCGTKSGRDMDKLIMKQIETGDHTVYIANVVATHGNPDLVNHLYSIHYTKLISIGSAGEIKLDLKFK